MILTKEETALMKCMIRKFKMDKAKEIREISQTFYKLSQDIYNLWRMVNKWDPELLPREKVDVASEGLIKCGEACFKALGMQEEEKNDKNGKESPKI